MGDHFFLNLNSVFSNAVCCLQTLIILIVIQTLLAPILSHKMHPHNCKKAAISRFNWNNYMEKVHYYVQCFIRWIGFKESIKNIMYIIIYTTVVGAYNHLHFLFLLVLPNFCVPFFYPLLVYCTVCTCCLLDIIAFYRKRELKSWRVKVQEWKQKTRGSCGWACTQGL
jgi:hypothetical protein